MDSSASLPRPRFHRPITLLLSAMALPPGVAAILVLLLALISTTVCILIVWHLLRRGMIGSQTRLPKRPRYLGSRAGTDSALEGGLHRQGADTPVPSGVVPPPPVYLNTLRSNERLLLFATAPPLYTPQHPADVHAVLPS
ncbi:hypothetical protein AURDEDRAFT_182173 [Auricularia subglabra TFB-10046 SS5]|nr:hypothetical protein AURDEDRAFT_182173 [Auricularia subglabra TFB-10046 SS5]